MVGRIVATTTASMIAARTVAALTEHTRVVAGAGPTCVIKTAVASSILAATVVIAMGTLVVITAVDAAAAVATWNMEATDREAAVITATIVATTTAVVTTIASWHIALRMKPILTQRTLMMYVRTTVTYGTTIVIVSNTVRATAVSTRDTSQDATTVTALRARKVLSSTMLPPRAAKTKSSKTKAVILEVIVTVLFLRIRNKEN